MESQSAQPIPEERAAESFWMPELNEFFQSSRVESANEQSNDQDISSTTKKTKFIGKQLERNYFENKKKARKQAKRTNHRKRIDFLERKIRESERQIEMLNRKYEYCPHCHSKLAHPSEELELSFRSQNENDNVAGSLNSRRNSRQSVEFEKINFSSNLMFNAEMDAKSWIYVGTTMLAIGSSIMEVDGTINVFKVLKDSVDCVRRQVQKSQKKINLELFSSKQDMKQPNNGDEAYFDPFFEKTQSSGFQLEGVKLQSVEQYELVYDQKINFQIEYEPLITAMQYLRGHCFIAI